jgi:hypothetical protein
MTSYVLESEEEIPNAGTAILDADDNIWCEVGAYYGKANEITKAKRAYKLRRARALHQCL